MSSFNMPVGSVVAIVASSSTPPNGWLYCNGETYNTEEYPELYAALQSSTVPDLQGYVLIGAGAYGGTGQTYDVMTTAGALDCTLTEDQMPSHQHFGWGEDGNGPFGQTTSASGTFAGSGNTDNNNYLFGTTFAGGSGAGATQLQTSDGSTAYKQSSANNSFSLLQPSFALNYFIYAGGE